tara:strand:- start:359 stop:529 length:171 start_codon:yes stop_codon:yes gene_type:complete
MERTAKQIAQDLRKEAKSIKDFYQEIPWYLFYKKISYLTYYKKLIESANLLYDEKN